MINYWPEFLSVALAHLLAVASPGPDFAIVLKQSLTHGRRVALWTSLGIGTGILLHVGYSLLGLGLLISRSELWFSVVKYSGAAYIAWLGWSALRVRPRTESNVENASASQPSPSLSRAFAKGFLTNALNPKATLFFLSLFVILVSPTTPRWLVAGYGLWMAVTTAAWFAFVSLVFTRPAVRDRFLRSGHWIDRGLGVVFLAFAVRLAMTSLR